MKLIDFTALFQLCATFYVAFIVIEYAKSYTSILTNNLFDFTGKLNTMASESKMDEKADLDEFRGDRFTSGKPFKFLESTKNKIVGLNEKIDKENADLISYVSRRCRFEQYRNISLYMFIYCFEMLILAGLEEWNVIFIYGFIRTQFFFSLLFVFLSFVIGVAGWLSDIKHRTVNVIVTIVYLAISHIASLLSAGGIWPQYDALDREALNCQILYSAILPLAVFLLGILYVWINGIRINHEITHRYKPITEERGNILKLIEEWRTHDIVENRYEENDTETITTE